MFTDKSIRLLEAPQKGQKTYYDGLVVGFGLRLSQGGAKTFVLFHGRPRRKITIGRYPTISLAEARGEAKRLLAEFTLGKTRPKSLTYANAVELFLQEKARTKRARTVADYTRLLGLMNFQSQLTDITHHDAAQRLDRIKAPSERSHALVASKVFWNWCVNRRYVNDNPFRGLQKPHHTPRDRVLSNDELVALWRATDEPTPYNRIIRFCILTAQRRGEVAQLQRHHVVAGILTTPSHIAKNNREHSFPLGTLAQEVLQHPTGDHLFNTSNRPFNNWSDAKLQLDKKSGVKNYTVHDIRRSVATKMAGDLQIPPHIIERILNHITGSMSAISRVYNRAAYHKEMAEAFEAWENHLSTLLKSE